MKKITPLSFKLINFPKLLFLFFAMILSVSSCIKQESKKITENKAILAKITSEIAINNHASEALFSEDSKKIKVAIRHAGNGNCVCPVVYVLVALAL